MSKRKDVEFALEFVGDYNARHTVTKLIDFVFAQADRQANVNAQLAQRVDSLEQSLKRDE